MSLLNKIKQQAAIKNLTLKVVANRAGINEKSMYAWDKSSPKVSNLLKVANVLNVTIDYLVSDEVKKSDKAEVALYGSRYTSDDGLPVSPKAIIHANYWEDITNNDWHIDDDTGEAFKVTAIKVLNGKLSHINVIE